MSAHQQPRLHSDVQCGVAGTSATHVVWWTARAAAAHAHRCATLATTWSTPHTPGSFVTVALVYPGMSCLNLFKAHGRSRKRCSLLGSAKQCHQGQACSCVQKQRGSAVGAARLLCSLVACLIGPHSVVPQCCPVIVVLLDYVAVVVKCGVTRSSGTWCMEATSAWVSWASEQSLNTVKILLRFATYVVLEPPVMMPNCANFFNVVCCCPDTGVTWLALFCRVPACKCLAPVHPAEAPSPSQAQAGPDEDFPVLGHPFNSLQEWDPSHEASLHLEHLWQIPPGVLSLCLVSGCALGGFGLFSVGICLGQAEWLPLWQIGGRKGGGGLLVRLL